MIRNKTDYVELAMTTVAVLTVLVGLYLAIITGMMRHP